MTDTIPAPNYTQIPNVLLDNLPLYSDAELRVMLSACRNTLGWHRERAALSNTYLQNATGLSSQGVRNGVKKLTTRGVLTKAGKGQRGVIIYGVNFTDPPTQLSSTPQLSVVVPPNTVDPTKKEKEKKEKNIAAAKESAEGSDSGKCAKCGVNDRIGDGYTVCKPCFGAIVDEVVDAREVEDGKLIDMTEPELDALKADVEQPLTTGNSLNPDPFEDKNSSPTTPLIPDDKLPKQNGSRFIPGPNGIEKKPLSECDNTPKRIVAKVSEPIAQTKPANIKAETVEVAEVVPEATPETPDEEKPLTPHQSMLRALRWAFDIKDEKNIIEWGQWNRASKRLRDAGKIPDDLVGWRTWNLKQKWQRSKPMQLVSDWQDYAEWREGRSFPTLETAIKDSEIKEPVITGIPDPRKVEELEDMWRTLAPRFFEDKDKTTNE